MAIPPAGSGRCRSRSASRRRQSQVAAGGIAGNECGFGGCGTGRSVGDQPLMSADTILQSGGKRMFRRQPVVGQEHGTLGRRREMSCQREIESAGSRNEAAAVQIQQPKIGVRAGCHHPFTGNIVNLHLDEPDALDSRLPACSHARTQPRQIKAVGAEGRVLAQCSQVLDALPRDCPLLVLPTLPARTQRRRCPSRGSTSSRAQQSASG